MNYKKSIILFLITISFSSKFHSIALPGLGEYKSEYKERSFAFFITESCLWLGLYYSSNSSQWYEDDYIAFAQRHASTPLVSKSNQYYINLSNYNNIYDYNIAMYQQRNPGAVYDVEDYYWSWDSSANQNRYSLIRYKSGLYNKYTKFLAAGLLLNRVVSFINMLYLERYDKQSKISSEIKLDSKYGFSMELGFNIF